MYYFHAHSCNEAEINYLKLYILCDVTEKWTHNVKFGYGFSRLLFFLRISRLTCNKRTAGQLNVWCGCNGMELLKGRVRNFEARYHTLTSRNNQPHDEWTRRLTVCLSYRLTNLFRTSPHCQCEVLFSIW